MPTNGESKREMQSWENEIIATINANPLSTPLLLKPRYWKDVSLVEMTHEKPIKPHKAMAVHAV